MVGVFLKSLLLCNLELSTSHKVHTYCNALILEQFYVVHFDVIYKLQILSFKITFLGQYNTHYITEPISWFNIPLHNLIYRVGMQK